jgi:hypothetical protein
MRTDEVQVDVDMDGYTITTTIDCPCGGDCEGC